MAGVLEQFHFLGKELKDNVLKTKRKNFWKEKELKKKVIVIRIVPFRGILEWLLQAFSPFMQPRHPQQM